MGMKMTSLEADAEKMKEVQSKGYCLAEIFRKAIDETLYNSSENKEELEKMLKNNEDEMNVKLSIEYSQCKIKADKIKKEYELLRKGILKRIESVQKIILIKHDVEKDKEGIKNIIFNILFPRSVKYNCSLEPVPDRDWIESAIKGTNITKLDIISAYENKKLLKEWIEEFKNKNKDNKHIIKKEEVRPIDKHINTTEKVNHFDDPMEIKIKDEEKQKLSAESEKMMKKAQNDFANIGGSTTEWIETKGDDEEEYMKDEETDKKLIKMREEINVLNERIKSGEYFKDIKNRQQENIVHRI